MGKDTLSTGQTLEGDDILVSSRRIFALGFFSPAKMSKNCYLGIWYYKVPAKRVVWVANRDKPVKNTSRVVSFHKSNKLVIYGGPDLKTPFWSTSFLGQGKNYSAQLLDTGNLVVFKEDEKRVIAWQSFDHPTDTWLPDMKIGLNLKTGLSWSLTSWKSENDPGTGHFSFRMDYHTREFSEFSLYEGPARRWRTGPLNHLVADTAFGSSHNFTYVHNEDEVFLIYSTYNLEIYSIMVVSEIGYVLRLMSAAGAPGWQQDWNAPAVVCDQYSWCGTNGICDMFEPSYTCTCLPLSEPMSNRSKGCLWKPDHNDCRNKEGFTKLSGLKLPATARVDRIQGGLKECEEECLRDCNCTAFANNPGVGSACVLWYGDLIDIRQLPKGGLDLYVRIDTAPNRTKHYSSSNKKRKVAAMVTSVGVVAFAVVFILCWLAQRRLRSRKERRHHNLSNGPDNSSTLFVERTITGDLPFFDLITLVEATNNFSHENKLGEGGFGSVYKGTLKNGQEIAVKRLSETSKQGLEEFKNEATLIAKHMHKYLVRLFGCCAQQEEKLLIYEFMPNGSLDSLIFDKTKSSCLDWEQRFNIIMGITRGMVYLHHDCRVRIIHRDLKASNVLLDAQMNPKISDFGMARFFEGDQVEGRTNRVVGTYGYMSPEYAANGTFSIKSDVFSFGVLLLEIITGRKNNSYYNNDETVNLISKVWNLWKENRALEIVDSSLGGDYSQKTVLRCIHVGLLSLQEEAIHRPTMSAIDFMLSNETNLQTPRPPGFYFNRTSDHASSSSVGTQSANELTLSVIEPR